MNYGIQNNQTGEVVGMYRTQPGKALERFFDINYKGGDAYIDLYRLLFVKTNKTQPEFSVVAKKYDSDEWVVVDYVPTKCSWYKNACLLDFDAAYDEAETVNEILDNLAPVDTVTYEHKYTDDLGSALLINDIIVELHDNQHNPKRHNETGWFPMDEVLRCWLEMTEEEAEDSQVTYYATTSGISTDVNGNEVSDEGWDRMTFETVKELHDIICG